MLKSLQEIFSRNDVTEPLNQKEDVKLAAATLMIELIRADGRIDQLEVQNMRALLRNQFELSDLDFNALFELAKKNAEDATSLYDFTREICDSWGNEKRVKLLENLWLLALSDNVIDPHERHLVRKVAGLLYLNESQIINSRENAKQKLKESTKHQ